MDPHKAEVTAEALRYRDCAFWDVQGQNRGSFDDPEHRCMLLPPMYWQPRDDGQPEQKS